MIPAARERESGGSERGGTLLGVLVLMVAFAAMSAACLASLPASLREISERTERASARYDALAVAARIQGELDAGRTGTFIVNVRLGVATTIAVGGDSPTLPPIPTSWQSSSSGDRSSRTSSTQMNAATAFTSESLSGGTVSGSTGTSTGSSSGSSEQLDLAVEPDGSATALATPQLDGSWLVVATGKRGASIVPFRRVLRKRVVAPFDKAVFGTNGVQLGGVVLVDSYRSDAGPYAAQAINRRRTGSPLYASDDGTIATNASVHVEAGEVHGGVVRGPGGLYTTTSCIVEGGVSRAGHAVTLSGADNPVPAANDNAALAGLVDGAGNLGLAAGGTVIGPGVYDVASFAATGSGVIEIAGDVTLHVRGAFRVNGGGQVIIVPGGSLKVHVSGAVDIMGGGISNRTGAAFTDPATGRVTVDGLPENLRIYAATGPLETAPPPVRVATPTPIFGVLYAPGRDLQIATYPCAWFGAAIAGSVVATVDTAFHRDETLDDGRGGSTARFRVIASWQGR